MTHTSTIRKRGLDQIAAAKDLPGIYLFVSRYVKSVRGGKRYESLVSMNDVLPD